MFKSVDQIRNLQKFVYNCIEFKNNRKKTNNVGALLLFLLNYKSHILDVIIKQRVYIHVFSHLFLLPTGHGDVM